ncbi:uncharacterized protein LOC133822013 [Humulus lupulus]|uniref:uncharacterized protein LOC133822013 n=1 Tax=Humulus lupulus TaxID=3486 RepID=UPI002B402EB3|nr:uncharacterized protein LOC133822013 [Humulus lupulus]
MADQRNKMMKMKLKISIVNENRFNDEQEEASLRVPIPIHSQVVKIKKEIEKIRHPSLQESDMRRILLLRNACTRLQQHTRSPLGLAERPLSLVGN